MLTITLRRAAATLAVAAGLLAAAGPASAQLPADAGGVTTPNTGPKALASAMWAWHEAARNGLTAAGPTEIYDHGITQADDRPTESVSFLKAAAEGTQVGSEGVKAPTKAQLGAANDISQLSLTQQGTQIGSEG